MLVCPFDHISHNKGSAKPKSNYLRMKYLVNKTRNSAAVLFSSIQSIIFGCYQTLKKDINGTAVFVIVAVEHYASFYRIFERQNMLFPNIF